MPYDPPKLNFVNVHSDGKGGRFAYFRSKETGRIRLPLTSAADFHQAYGEASALRDRLRAGRPAQDPESFTGLVDAYQRSVEFRALADSTQLDYSKTCLLIADPDVGLGKAPYRYTTRSMIKALRDDHADTTRKANKIGQMVSRLYSWASECELVPDGFNPAAGLKRLKRQGGTREYVPWSDQEVTWATSVAPAHVLTPLLIALYTGQRRADVRAMTWQQDQGDFLRVRTAKTRVLIDLPCHPKLRAHLDQVRKGSKVVQLAGPICLASDGRPWSTDNAMSGALRRVVEGHARIPNNRSFHGLRYAAAARMEAGGATVASIEAVLGHRTFKMALKYASARLRATEGVAAMKGEA